MLFQGYQKIFNKYINIIFFASFIQITILSVNIVLYTLLAVFIFISLFFLSSNKCLDKSIAKYIIFYNTPFILSLVVSLPISFLISSPNLRYEDIDFAGRLVNLILFSYTIIILETKKVFYKENSKYLHLFRSYWFGSFILLLTGVWQAISKYTGIIPFPFETRSHVHGASQELANTISFRLTGIASEPSYIVTYIIDFILITYMLYKGKYRIGFICLGLFVLFLTFSPSGYLLIVAILSFSFVSYLFRYPKMKTLMQIIVSLVVICSILFFIISKYSYSLDYLLSRINNAGDSGRFIDLKVTIEYMFNSNIFNLLFGYGLKAFPLISNSTSITYNTTNNLYIDIFHDSGLIGLFTMLFFFGYLLFKIFKTSNKKNFVLGCLLFYDLTISAMFKADYAILRSFILIYFIYILCVKSKPYKI